MRTREEGEGLIVQHDLRNASVNESVDQRGIARRELRFDNPRGLGEIEIEIDADPSDRQLADLARHLPTRLEPSARRI